MASPAVSFRPQQSFKHTLKEIAVNREDPCELVRELVSNAYDAKATKVLVMPYLQGKGLVFFDNGVGLSESPKDAAKTGVVPYVAFFSIGTTTKIKGSGIGYKCQGSKLCFASTRVAVITRSTGEPDWRVKVIDNPKQVLDENFDLTPVHNAAPWNLFSEMLIPEPEQRSLALLQTVSEKFFLEEFESGTLIFVENFDVQDYGKYFSVGDEESSYLFNYLRFFTAHGDVRSIEDAGFTAVDKNVIDTNRKTNPIDLSILMDPVSETWELRKIAYGYPYLPVTKEDEDNISPSAANRLRDGRFYGRYATVFDHSGQKFSIILTVDGKRRTLDSYKQLGRQKNSGCGIPLSSQRGVILTSHGVRICSYNELFREDALADYDVLSLDTEHYLLFIDGPFELTTNRNSPAPDSLKLLKEAGFLEKVKAFLADVSASRPRGAIFRELVSRLGEERTHEREEQYLKLMERAKTSLPGRSQFSVEDVPVLRGKWFIEPAVGEENMVGALFTLFSHLVPKESKAVAYWSRPLTFSAYGIDAITSRNEANLKESLEYLEYKHIFSADIEFNHPFSITNEIVLLGLLPGF